MHRVHSLGELAFALVVVGSVVGDRGELSAAVVLVVDVVSHILQVLHVGSVRGDEDERTTGDDRTSLVLNLLLYSETPHQNLTLRQSWLNNSYAITRFINYEKSY